MPKVIKKKTQQKKALSPEMEIHGTIEDIREVLKRRQRMLSVAGLIVITAIIVVSGVLYYSYSTRSQAQRLEYEAYGAYTSEQQAQSAAEEERLRKALDLFQQSYGKKESPRVLFYIANVLHDLGRYEEALKTLANLTSKHQKEEEIIPLAYLKTAEIYRQLGKSEEALKALETLMKTPGEVLKDAALINTARILEAEGKKDEAMVKYKELVEKYPKSPHLEEAKARAGEKKEG